VKVVPLAAAALLLGELALRARRGQLGRGGAALRLLVLAGLVAYGLGLVHPPNLERVLTDLGRRLGPWTYGLVGLLAFLETGAFVGLIAPGELTILVGGVVAGQGRISIVALLAVVWACAVGGDLASFYLGRRLGREFLVRHGPRVRITHERLEKVEGFFERHGGAAIFLGRFVGLVRAVAPFTAGASKMPLRRFLPFDVVGAGIWGCGLALLGYAFWASFHELAAAAKKGALALGLVIALLVGLIAGYRWLRREENRRRVRAWAERQPVLGVALRRAPAAPTLEGITLVALALVGGFAFFALAAQVDPPARPPLLDREAAGLAARLRTGPAVSLLRVLTDIGSSPVTGLAVLAAAAGLGWRRRRLPEAAALLTGAILTFVAVSVAKAAAGRARPSGSLIGTIHSASYPSGHAAYSVAFVAVAVAVSPALPRLAARISLVGVGVALAVFVGLSRVYLRAHYLTDVLGGWGLAAALFALGGLGALAVARVRHNGRR